MPTSELPELLQQVEKTVADAGESARELAWPMLSRVADVASVAPVTSLKNRLGLSGDGLERLLVWHAVQQTFARLEHLRIDPAVRHLLEKELHQLLAPRTPVPAGSYEFQIAAKFATLRRFPSGPMDWELSCIPRSWLFRPALPDMFRLLWVLISKGIGRGPCFYMHVAPNPRKRALVLEREVLRSYHRMARSLELEPQARAIVATAWFHDPAAVRDSPHLEVLSRPYLQHGGYIFIAELAEVDSGILERNPKRKAEFESGRLQYRIGFAVWPRNAALQWAAEHPELAT